MKTLIGLLLLALALPALGATYRWVDENGVVHYSDRPQEDAEEIDLGSAQSYQPATSTRSLSRDSRAATDPPPAPPPYESLRVVRPAEQSTYRNIGGQLPVTLSLTPALKQGHRLRVYFDGQPVANWPERLLSFTLTDVYRGEHNLRAEIIGVDGETIIASDPVTFFVHQTNLLNRVRN